MLLHSITQREENKNLPLAIRNVLDRLVPVCCCFTVFSCPLESECPTQHFLTYWSSPHYFQIGMNVISQYQCAYNFSTLHALFMLLTHFEIDRPFRSNISSTPLITGQTMLFYSRIQYPILGVRCLSNKAGYSYFERLFYD